MTKLRDPGLLLCPFCGGEPMWSEGATPSYRIYCSECPAETSGPTPGQARHAWDTRAPAGPGTPHDLKTGDDG